MWTIKDLKIQNLIKDLKEGECHPDWDDFMYQLASTKEGKSELFEHYINEKDEETKVLLAHVLAKVGDTRVIPFLVEVVNKLKRYNSTAAFALLRLNYPDIKNIFIKVLEDKRNPREWLSDPLYRINSKLSDEILEELMKRDEEIKLNVEAMESDPDFSRYIEDKDW